MLNSNYGPFGLVKLVPNLQVVVIVGSSQSGQDILMELVGVAKEVYLSARSAISEGFSKFISKHHNLHLHSQVYLKY